jgi:hypothetical protein
MARTSFVALESAESTQEERRDGERMNSAAKRRRYKKVSFALLHFGPRGSER